MNKKVKPTKPTSKKKAAIKPPKEGNPNQLEDFNKVLERLFTPVVPDKR